MTLKPCPFCEGKNIIAVGGVTFKWHKLICCDCSATCGDVRGNADLTPNIEALETAWNTRAGLSIDLDEAMLSILDRWLEHAQWTREEAARRIVAAELRNYRDAQACPFNTNKERE